VKSVVGLLRRHWLLAVLLLAGIALRVMATLAYRPALLYVDSLRYLKNLHQLRPDDLNPIGYDLVLRPLLAVGDLRLVVVLQHLAGLGLAVALYVLVLRLGGRRWLAALAAAPVLLDAYQVQIEQNIMAETVFEVLLVAMLWVLLARPSPGWRRAAAAGVLVGAAGTVRTIGAVVVVAVLAYLLLAGRTQMRRAMIRTGAALTGFVVVLGSYAGYYAVQAGHVAITGSTPAIRYGRTAVVADCDRLPLNNSTRLFCPPEPLGQRKGVDFYAHSRYGDPNWPQGLPPGSSKPALAREFSNTVLRHQPLDVAVAVLKDFAKGFAPTRTTSPNDVPLSRWQFQREYPLYHGEKDADPVQLAERYGGSAPTVNDDLARILRAYQLNGGYTPGSALGIAALLGLAGACFGRSRRSAALLATASGLLLLLGSAMFEFSWRYQLPALVLLPTAGALGLAALLGSRSNPLAAFPDDVDRQALDDFRDEHGDPTFAPVVVLIAAYQEENGIAAVLRSIPRSCAGLPVDTLVVVDGGNDATAKVAATEGVYVCDAEINRGQGAALRLGYRVAAAGGARYIVTTDADGQYDATELPALLAPILADEADFVTGSRRLGREQADSRVRWLGVRVFAALASALTRQRISDTSFGFRAMRAELVATLPLREPQYQASELLLSVIARGARVAEVPMTMRVRDHGASKKGPNLAYGANYARVMLGTWWRELVRRTRTGRTSRTSVRT
jgi:hypothetical protein